MRLLSFLFLAAKLGLAATPERSLPVFFFPTAGQTGSSIRYVAQTSEMQIGFAADGVIFRTHQARVRARFAGGNPTPVMEGIDALPGKVNFFSGSRSERDVQVYRGLAYGGVYPGIDLKYRGTGNRVKSEFLVSPGGDPGRIRIEYEGAVRISIAANGDLLVGAGGGELREEAPLIYQDSDHGRVRVEGRYRVLDAGAVGFEIGVYDRARLLVIDPVVSYCTYLGGSGMGAVTGAAVDSTGNLYVTGWTEALDFPIVGAAQAANQGGVDVFVAKLNPAGNTLLYATYIGGRGDDRAAAIAVDSTGQAYVTGSTASTNFPVVSAIRSALGGSRNAFVFKLNAAGNGLIYSTYLGGSTYDKGNAIAVDGSGNAYIAGDTYSANFPVLGAAQSLPGGSADAFITKLSPSGALLFSTFLGGAGDEHAAGIALDSSRSVYLAGGTFSTNFPVSGAIQSTNQGGQDAFVTKLGSTGGSIVYSTYLGGSGAAVGVLEQANGIAVDSSGNAYVAGVTNSANFPVTAGALRTTYNGVQDAFVVKINAAGSALGYGAYLGGSSFNWASGIAVDASGGATVAGCTSSADFPVSGAVQAAFNGLYDGFVSTLNAAGNALTFSTLYGGAGSDVANAIAIDASGNIFIGGQTSSVDLALQGPLQATNPGRSMGWVMRLGTPPGTAQFIRTDATTQGTWRGVYGADGYNVINNAVSYPTYVAPAPSGNLAYTWASATSDVRALQQPSASQRIAAAWYTYNQFVVDLPFSGTQTYQMAVYCLDWDNIGRAETLEILDAGNRVLDSRSITSFGGGTWVLWSLSGHVQLRVTRTGGSNAAISGIFFGAPGTPVANTGTAQFVRTDTTTQGAWRGVYGADGYNVINNAVSYPSYVFPAPTGNAVYTWVAVTSDVRALQQAGSSQRIAATWYTYNQFIVDLPFSGTQSYQMAVYCLDWDNLGRVETLEILDANNTVLDSRTAGNFSAGTWVVWTLSGHVQLRVTRSAGQNAVISGIFFGGASATATAQFVRLDTATQGTWRGVYGSDGYNVINDAVSYPPYVTPAPSGNAAYTWAASTTDIRALQQTTSTQRFAGTWYSYDQFVIDLPFSGALLYRMAVYCLDWDNLARTETLEVLDANNIVLDTRTIGNFVAGTWAVWNLSGHVRLRVTRTAGANAVISGLFFGP